MRLIFIHGINNQDNTVESIKTEWWEALKKSWQNQGLAIPATPQIDVAFFADILHEFTISANQNDFVTMGGQEQDNGLALELLNEYSTSAGISEEELAEAANRRGLGNEPIQMGFPHSKWLIDIADVLESILPGNGRFIAKLFLKQAAAYVGNRGLAAKIDQKVHSQIFKNKSDPAVIVAHSLGSVVAYRLLANRNQINRDIPLFITLGSPLSVRMMQEILPPSAQFPNPPILEWINGRHPDDFITLGRSLSKETIGFSGIHDEVNITNPETDKHSIVHYLSSPNISRPIYEMLKDK